MFNQCQPAEAIQQYAGAVYTQHNPGVAMARPAFWNVLQRVPNTAANPNTMF